MKSMHVLYALFLMLFLATACEKDEVFTSINDPLLEIRPLTYDPLSSEEMDDWLRNQSDDLKDYRASFETLEKINPFLQLINTQLPDGQAEDIFGAYHPIWSLGEHQEFADGELLTVPLFTDEEDLMPDNFLHLLHLSDGGFRATITAEADLHEYDLRPRYYLAKALINAQNLESEAGQIAARVSPEDNGARTCRIYGVQETASGYSIGSLIYIEVFGQVTPEYAEFVAANDEYFYILDCPDGEIDIDFWQNLFHGMDDEFDRRSYLFLCPQSVVVTPDALTGNINLAMGDFTLHFQQALGTGAIMFPSGLCLGHLPAQYTFSDPALGTYTPSEADWVSIFQDTWRFSVIQYLSSFNLDPFDVLDYTTLTPVNLVPGIIPAPTDPLEFYNFFLSYFYNNLIDTIRARAIDQIDWANPDLTDEDIFTQTPAALSQGLLDDFPSIDDLFTDDCHEDNLPPAEFGCE
ncbi:MAG: hypothetical protein AAFZ63_10345 [Bacteroidota bacterium]